MATVNINVCLSAVRYDGIPFEIKRYTRNAETSEALSEFEEMKNNPEKYKRYDSFDDIVNEVIFEKRVE